MKRQMDEAIPHSAAATPAPAGPLKPQFYVVRPNGNATPLIALDELPECINVQGVPRLLSVADVDDMLRMPGKHEVRQNIYTVVDNSKPTTPPVTAPLDSGFGFPKPKANTANQDTTSVDDKEIFPGPKKYFGIEEAAPKQAPQPATEDVASKVAPAFDNFEPLPEWKATENFGDRRPLKGKKIYCSHWMSTGECDYAQQGCLYKHEMPLDIELLQHLGFRDIPKWYRERHGIGKLTAVPGSGAHIEGPADTPAHMHATWRPMVNQRLPRASPLATARTRVVAPHLNRRATSTVLAPRPTRAMSHDLISLESRPATPATAANRSLLNSKFASLQPVAEKSKSQDSVSNKSASSPESTYARLDDNTNVTPGTSVESLTALKLQHHTDILSRRTSIATDYETALFKDQQERDEQEFKVAAELDAYAASRREQAASKLKQEAALAVAREAMLNNPKNIGSGNVKAAVAKKGGRKSCSGRGAVKRVDSAKSAVEIKV